MPTPNTPCDLGRELGSQLARFAEAELADHPEKYVRWPERCGSCAFRAGTVPNGCLSSVADALKCVTEGDVFLCHEDFGVHGRPTKPCRGWAILREAGGASGPVELPWPYSDDIE